MLNKYLQLSVTYGKYIVLWQYSVGVFLLLPTGRVEKDTKVNVTWVSQDKLFPGLLFPQMKVRGLGLNAF